MLYQVLLIKHHVHKHQNDNILMFSRSHLDLRSKNTRIKGLGLRSKNTRNKGLGLRSKNTRNKGLDLRSKNTSIKD